MSEEFFEAVRAGDVSKVKALLRKEPSLKDARTPSGTHAAVLALYHGRPEVSKAILACRPVLDLHSAAAVGDFERVKEIVEADPASVDAKAADGFAALGLASYLGHRPVVGYLLNKGADVNYATPQDGFTALTGAISSGHADVVEVLLANRADPNHRYEGGNTPLTEAAFNGDPRIVRTLLDHGADVRARTDGGKTALDIAQEKGHREVADLLRARGAPE